MALRPEPFGALAYHYGNRRLTFIRSEALVGILGGLSEHLDVLSALDDAGVARASRPSYLRALSQLEQSEVIRARRS
ncbi:MAG: mycofactocin biosynthesis chaperone MftB [Acidimicrobiales bacterium]